MSFWPSGRLEATVAEWSSDITFPIHGYKMRQACARCGHQLGQIDRKSGQDVVSCENCGRFSYNAPRHETGLPG